MNDNPFDALLKLNDSTAYCRIYSFTGDDLKLDLDFIREILLAIEAKEDLVFTKIQFNNRSEDLVKKHLNALMDAGLIYGKPYGQYIYVSDLTWEGHEFLEKVRNPETWGKTKAALKKTGEWSLKATADIATAIIKMKIEQFLRGEGSS